MITKKVVILNKLGMHARPASQLVQRASKFGSEIFIENDEGLEVNAKSIMGVLMLGAVEGTELTLKAEGEDAEDALDEISSLFADKFGEE